MALIITDRSRVLSHQTCPRLRYWAYEFNPNVTPSGDPNPTETTINGLAPVRKSLPLVFGSAFHEAPEVFLDQSGEISATDRVELAVRRGVSYLDEAFSVASVDMDEPITQFHMAEQKAMVEALVRGWWARAGEGFHGTFEVLEVEKEGRAELTKGMTLVFRPDALVRDRTTGELFVISWKTASSFGKLTIDQSNVDMQSMSEVFGLTETMNTRSRTEAAEMARQLNTFVAWGSNGAPVEGVIYLYIVKGKRWFDKYRGHKIQNSHLIYAWHKPGPTSEDDEWSWCYEWKDEDEPERSRKLGKGWRKVAVWEEYPGGVQGWINALAEQRVNPRHVSALEEMFPEMLPVSRRASEIESWRRQVVSQETKIAQSAARVEAAKEHGLEAFHIALDAEFPQHTKSCLGIYNSKCSMYDVCWNSAVAADPMASDLYSIRIPNHPEQPSED